MKCLSNLKLKFYLKDFPVNKNIFLNSTINQRVPKPEQKSFIINFNIRELTTVKQKLKLDASQLRGTE